MGIPSGYIDLLAWEDDSEFEDRFTGLNAELEVQ